MLRNRHQTGMAVFGHARTTRRAVLLAAVLAGTGSFSCALAQAQTVAGAGFAYERQGDTYQFSVAAVEGGRNQTGILLANYDRSSYGIHTVQAKMNAVMLTVTPDAGPVLEATGHAKVLFDDGDRQQVPMMVRLSEDSIQLMLGIDGELSGGKADVVLGGTNFYERSAPGALAVGVIDGRVASGESAVFTFALALRDEDRPRSPMEGPAIGRAAAAIFDELHLTTLDAELQHSEVQLIGATVREAIAEGRAQVVSPGGEVSVVPLEFIAEAEGDGTGTLGLKAEDGTTAVIIGALTALGASLN